MGSKRKLAHRIVDVIFNRHNSEKFYDLFGGGGAVSFAALSQFDEVHYNEIDTAIVELIKEVKESGFNPEWWQPITREECNELKTKKTAKAAIAKTCWRFGNNANSGYLWGKEIEQLKLSAHDFIVNNTEEAQRRFNELSNLNLPLFTEDNSIYQRRMILKKSVKGRFDLERLQSLQSLQSLESLQRLERLQSLERLELSNLTYERLNIDKNSVVYCDIPYRMTEKYSEGCTFDHDIFYKWALTRDHPVYISEYQMPPEFTEIVAFSHRSTLSSTNNSKKTIEKLYWNGVGDIIRTTLF